QRGGGGRRAFGHHAAAAVWRRGAVADLLPGAPGGLDGGGVLRGRVSPCAAAAADQSGLQRLYLQYAAPEGAEKTAAEVFETGKGMCYYKERILRSSMLCACIRTERLRRL